MTVHLACHLHRNTIDDGDILFLRFNHIRGTLAYQMAGDGWF